jgi:hypothetical protein
MKRLGRFIVVVLYLWTCLLIGVALGTLITGCGVVSSDGRGRVSVSRCDVIVGDELGELPEAHGGPRSRASYGDGIECRIWKF